jgi:hypothetical protein
VVALVSVETVLLVLLVVLVAALLRSHAEILRRLGPEEEGVPRPRDLAPPPARDRVHVYAPELVGTTPTGDAVKLAFDGGPTLLAFLSSGCTSCAGFWETLGRRRIPAVPETVIVTRGPDREQRAKLRSLPPEGVPVLMSSQAWEDYAVPGSPYFVLVQGGAIRGEGAATTWHALASLVGDAIEEQNDASAQARGRGVEDRLAAAGIGPEHPSLYPGGSD